MIRLKIFENKCIAGKILTILMMLNPFVLAFLLGWLIGFKLKLNRKIVGDKNGNKQ